LSVSYRSRKKSLRVASVSGLYGGAGSLALLRVILKGMFNRLSILLISFFILIGQAPAQSHPGIQQVEFVSSYSEVYPGQKFTAGVRFILEPEWHVYWVNPGDSGLPPTFEWSDSLDFVVGEIAWPLPERIPVAHLVNFGYEGEVYFPFEITLDSELAIGDTVHAMLLVDWLVCKEDCLPGSQEFEISFETVAAESVVSTQFKDPLINAVADSPHSLELLEIESWTEDGQLVLSLEELPGVDRELEYFFPEQQGIIRYAATQQEITENDLRYLRIPLATNAPEPPFAMRGLLSHFSLDKKERKALMVVSTVNDSREDQPIGFVGNLWQVLLFGFLGGLILNLMPCVFPVISIKVFSFISHARSNPAATKIHGLLFGAGVISSFWVLALALVLLRASGQTLGWGFQLQSPWFIWGMCFLFVALALNLLGVFEVGGKLQQIGGKVKTSSGYSGSFLTGVLATIVASPCTAPFMATALSVALFMPIHLSLLVFTALGAGMAAPYVLLSFFPELVSRLPKGGQWLITLKQLMAFPLLATVVWLFSVYVRQVNAGALISLVAALLLFSLALFIYGASRSWRSGRSIGLLFAVTLGLVAFYWGAPGENIDQKQEQGSVELVDGREGSYDEYGLFWLKFSPEVVTELQEDGEPVFIDFTAQWCITCLANKRLVFSSREVREFIGDKNIRLVKADWTSLDDEITEALAGYGRSGVPFNVLYPGGQNVEEPVEFPSLLTPGLVLRVFREHLE